LIVCLTVPLGLIFLCLTGFFYRRYKLRSRVIIQDDNVYLSIKF